ncbi:MAG: FAD-dependent oxidoreductase, partial [Bacteroidota bacterium]
GAGLTGLQTALKLKERYPQRSITVVERGPFSRGASTRNAGFACFGSPTEILEDLENEDASIVWDTVAKRYQGICQLKAKYGPVIDYHSFGGYELYTEKAILNWVMEALPVLNDSLKRITGQEQVFEWRNQVPGIRSSFPLIHNRLEGQLHPGRLVKYLERECQSKEIQLLFGINIEQIEQEAQCVHLSLANGEVLIAQQVILTTNAFTPDLLPNLAIQAARNQVLITAPIHNLQLKGCYHYDRGYVYLRNVGDRLLIGGARHLAKQEENTPKFGPNQKLLEALESYLHQWIDLPSQQVVRVAQSWSGIIAQGSEKSPIIEQVGERVIVAARLAGMGVALSAQIAEDAVALVRTYE